MNHRSDVTSCEGVTSRWNLTAFSPNRRRKFQSENRKKKFKKKLKKKRIQKKKKIQKKKFQIKKTKSMRCNAEFAPKVRGHFKENYRVWGSGTMPIGCAMKK